MREAFLLSRSLPTLTNRIGGAREKGRAAQITLAVL
jgi:hypothetical protein